MTTSPMMIARARRRNEHTSAAESVEYSGEYFPLLFATSQLILIFSDNTPTPPSDLNVLNPLHVYVDGMGVSATGQHFSFLFATSLLI